MLTNGIKLEGVSIYVETYMVHNSENSAGKKKTKGCTLESQKEVHV